MPVTIRADELRKYLDTSIRQWRAIRDTEPTTEEETRLQPLAPCYIDAYQCVRASFLGAPLP